MAAAISGILILVAGVLLALKKNKKSKEEEAHK